ncbi:MAG: preprotein translocase subunit SecG [Candidatus Tectomicrobia bacterium]|nr:preprotein translocase subunit SecG [Candidatus Tectomicrobia bacterium]
MYAVLILIHVVVALALILIVLLQTGKGASLGSAFGGASQTVFGSRGAGSFLGKVTTAAAILFMLTSLTLAFISSRSRFASVVKIPLEQSQPSSVTPAQSPEPAAPAPAQNVAPQEEPKPSQGSGSPSSP